MVLAYTASKGLHEVEEATLDWHDGEFGDAFLQRTGFKHKFVNAGDRHGTGYALYERTAKPFSYMVEFSDGEGYDNIYCETKVDLIACRAFLAPIVTAESYTKIDLDESVSGLVNSDKKGVVSGLWSGSKFVQFIAALVREHG
jgi:hypothetical protein